MSVSHCILSCLVARISLNPSILQYYVLIKSSRLNENPCRLGALFFNLFKIVMNFIRMDKQDMLRPMPKMGT